VAEPTTAGRAAVGRRTWWGPYGALLSSRLRSQFAYRRSFVLDVLGSFGVGLVEFAEIYVIFSSISALGGLDFSGMVLLFGLANISFSLADLLVGHIDRIPFYLRTGTLDALLLRPLPVLAQLVTSDVQLRRFGRIVLALVVLVIALVINPVEATPATVALLVITPIAGTAIFSGLFVCAAGVQFWLIEGSEMANAFTYGSSYAAQFPTSIFTVPMRVLFTFVVPAAFTAYLPTLLLLGVEGPAWTPAWLGWLTPLAAAAVWGVGMLLWRAGLRHYTGAGS
jgi:ABC-2 type transport system permease protein